MFCSQFNIMNRSLLLTACLLVVFFQSSAQNNWSTDDRWVRRHFSDLGGGLKLSTFETTNAAYRQFLQSLLQSGKTEEYLRCLPDTQVWASLGVQALPMVNHYFRDAAYDEYPVVGVSRSSVDSYLNWLTDTYRSHKGARYSQAVFCLPTQAEWTRAAQGGDTSKTYPWGTGFIRNSRGADLCNYRHAALRFDSLAGRWIEVPEPSKALVKLTSRVDAYFPNAFGLYNMSGNVAEMIDLPEIAMGGSYNDPAWQVRTTSIQKIGSASPFVGFRVALRMNQNP